MLSGFNFKGFPAEASGVFRVSLFAKDMVVIENHSGIADMKPECIKIFADKSVVAIKGEGLAIGELDGYVLKITGKILSIEYLT